MPSKGTVMIKSRLPLIAFALTIALLTGCTQAQVQPSDPHAVAPAPAEQAESIAILDRSDVDLSAKKTLTKEDVIEALTQPKTRSIRKGASFDQIRFDFNSDHLTTDARKVLDVVAAALKSPELQHAQIVVEGHTDAKGTLPYNLALSKRRAESVKHYLVATAKVPADALTTAGKGSTDLLDKAHPESGANRRVVFVSQ